MNNRFFSHLVAREYTAKGDKSFFIKAKFSEEVRIQEEALKIFNLLEEFHNKYQHYFALKITYDYQTYYKNMNALKGTFSDIAYSNPLEGVFENLCFNQFRCFIDPSRIYINKYTLIDEMKTRQTIDFLQSEFNKIAEVINKFENDHSKSFDLSFYFNGQVSILCNRLHNLTEAIQEALDLIDKKGSESHYLMFTTGTTSLQITAPQMAVLCDVKHEISAMHQILERIGGKLGDYVPGVGGYSSLSDEDKKQYNELPTQFKNWQEALNIIDRCDFSFNSYYGESFKSFCSDLKEKISNLKNAIIQNDDYRDHEYSKRELEKFKFPRSVDDSRAKLKDEISVPTIKSHIR